MGFNSGFKGLSFIAELNEGVLLENFESKYIKRFRVASSVFSHCFLSFLFPAW